MNDEEYMGIALLEANKAYAIDETPVGAVIVCDGEIISAKHNLRQTKKNALYHAELLCIDEACKKLGGWRLHKCEMYVTLEPCPMCAGAIINSRIKRLVYGASDSKAGSFGSVINMAELPYNHKPEIVSGICASECSDVLRRFFKELREKHKLLEEHSAE